MKSEKEEAIEQIRNTQAELYARLRDLDRDIAALSVQRKESPDPDETIESSTVASEEPVRTQGALAAAKEAAVPPPLPKSAIEAQVLGDSGPQSKVPSGGLGEEEDRKVPFAAVNLKDEGTPAGPSTPPSQDSTQLLPSATPEEQPPPSRPDSADGLEIKLGTYWLVRIGVLMVLTGFVFLAKHFLTSDEVAAGLKVSSLYLLSGALLGAGSWIGKTRERMRNYGEVLSAGGFAAVYFTTFGAHKVPGLAIISSPLLAGILLLFWAGVMVYIADRKRSQTLASMGVLLAYYTLVIDEASLFSLFSALILSGVALVFLVRNRWTLVGSLSLAGTYLAFAYWRFSEHLMLVGTVDSSPSSFWPSYGFLICYWATFTAAAFLSEHLPEQKRSILAGLNNAAFLVLFGLGMGRHHPEQFWIFSLIAGVVFLAVSEVADRRLGRGTLLGTLYLAKGLGLLTLAFFLKLSGFSLSILIAAESCVLLVLASYRRSKVLEAGAYLSAGLAVLYTFISEFAGPGQLWFVEFTDGVPLIAVFAQLIFLGFGAWWLRNRAEAIAPEVVLEPRTLMFLGLGVLAFLLGAYDDIAEAWRPLVFVGFGSVAAALGTWRRFKLVELALVGQAFSVVAALIFFGQLAGPGVPSLAQSIPVLLAFLALIHWSVDGRGPLAGKEGRGFFEWPFALVLVISLLCVFVEHASFLGGISYYFPGLLALALLLYGYRMRIPSLAILSQGYHLFAAVEIDLRATGQEPWLLALVPLVLLLCNITVADFLFRSADPDSRSKKTLDGIATGLCLLRILALYFFADFVFTYLPEIWQAPIFSLAALILHTLAIRHKNIQRFTFGLILLGASAALVLSRDRATGQEPWLLALVPLVLLLCNIVVADLFLRSADPESRSQKTLDVVATVVCLLRILALYFFADFVFRHLPEIWQAPIFSLAALILHTLAIRHKNIQRFTFGLILLGASAALVLFRDAWDSNPTWQIYLTALVPLVVQQLTRRKGGLAAEHLIYHVALSTSSVGLIWLVLSLEIDAIGQGFYLTASWTLLGALVFAAGWFLRERIYRLMSLALITSALIRLLAVEVWTLGSIGRIITFILIGVVLLALGFVYTRYQDKLRRIF